jgi:hypothetical protein
VGSCAFARRLPVLPRCLCLILSINAVRCSQVCGCCYRHLGFGFGGARFVTAVASSGIRAKGPVVSKASREGDSKKALLGPAPGAHHAHLPVA